MQKSYKSSILENKKIKEKQGRTQQKDKRKA